MTVLIRSLFSAGRAFASTGCFTDTNGYWAETFICWLKDNNISSGYGNGTYGPDDNITRGQMAVFLQKIFQLADSSATTKANTAEASAKAYADSKANTAETNAKAYADTVANIAENYAQEYANSLHTGEIRVNSGPNSWDYAYTQPNPSTLTIYRYDEYFGVTSSIAKTTFHSL